LLELQSSEKAAGNALLQSNTSGGAAAVVSSLYERPKDPNEANVRAGIARQLDSELGPAAGEQGKVRIEIVHKNPPAGTSANVTSSPNVETEMKTDRQQAPLGDQYAYSPGNF
ncbi:TPA: phage tail protein, partial [Burkholderia vietnamiensis]|nr:phage tail protein [Burkholderia vietnamiensis]